MKPTNAQIKRNRELSLGRFDFSSDSMRIVRDAVADVHVGDQVRYISVFNQHFNEIGTVTELIGSGWLGVHFPHCARGTNLKANISDFRLVTCDHESDDETQAAEDAALSRIESSPCNR